MAHTFPIEAFTARQQKFIIEYCKTQHLTNSAIAAGANPKTAAVVGSKWFKNPKIKAEIDRRIASRLDRYEVDPQKIIREMALLAFSSLDDFIAFTEDNEALVDFSGVTRDQMASLTEIVTEEMKTSSGTRIGLRTKLKLTDKRAALMDLAKLIQMLGPDRVEHSGQVNHLHAHTVLNPRDMNPHQRQLLKQALLAIDNDEKGDEDDAADHHQAG